MVSLSIIGGRYRENIFIINDRKVAGGIYVFKILNSSQFQMFFRPDC